MNKEIKKEFFDRKDVYSDGCYEYLIDGDAEDVWNWIDQKLKEQYLQGAKDMYEVVKLKDLESTFTGAMRTGYAHARTIMRKQAQQFIDSLEKQK